MATGNYAWPVELWISLKDHPGTTVDQYEYRRGATIAPPPRNLTSTFDLLLNAHQSDGRMANAKATWPRVILAKAYCSQAFLLSLQGNLTW